MNNANGISPVVAILLTLVVAALACWLFIGGHMVWGVIFSLIFLDFLADAILSFRKVSK